MLLQSSTFNAPHPTLGYWTGLCNTARQRICHLTDHRSVLQSLQQYLQDYRIFWIFAKQRESVLLWIITYPSSSPCNSLKPRYFGILQNSEIVNVKALAYHQSVLQSLPQFKLGIFWISKNNENLYIIYFSQLRATIPATVSNHDILGFRRTTWMSMSFDLSHSVLQSLQ